MRPTQPNLSIQIDHSRRHARAQQIAALYAEGVPTQDIADNFEISRTTVLRYARLWKLPKRSKRIFSERTRDKVIKEWKRGDKLKDIAKRNGVSEAYVSLLLKSMGKSRYAV